MTSKSGLEYAESIIEEWNGKVPIICWASLPCTWGSPLQDINAWKYPANHEQRMKQHWHLFECLHKNFMILMTSLTKNPLNKIIYEWPRTNYLWDEQRVKDMITKYDLQPVEVDGCMLGLKSTEGVPMKKGWTLQTNLSWLAHTMHGRLCDGRHRHQTVGGKETARTALYTVQMAYLVHIAIGIYAIREKGREDDSDPPHK